MHLNPLQSDQLYTWSDGNTIARHTRRQKTQLNPIRFAPGQGRRNKEDGGKRRQELYLHAYNKPRFRADCVRFSC